MGVSFVVNKDGLSGMHGCGLCAICGYELCAIYGHGLCAIYGFIIGYHVRIYPYSSTVEQWC